MGNPARELLEIFEGWRAGAPPGVQRQLDKTPGVDDVRRAMHLIEEMHYALNELEANGTSMQLYRDASAKWVHNVLAYPNGWQDNQASNHLYAAARIDMLQSLVILLDASPARVNMQHAANFDTYLASIIDLLATDEGIDDALRAHIAKLVTHVKRALDEYKATGRFDAEDALTQLWVSLIAAEARSKGHKGQWRKFAAELRVPVSSGVIVSLPMLAIEAVKLLS